MIISDSERFVFVHNPKVGGMTMRSELIKYDTRENFFFEWKEEGKNKRLLDMAHLSLVQFRKLYPDVFSNVSGYFKFAFVRNPYTRFFSAVSQHLKLCTPYVRNTIIEDDEIFYDFSSRLTQRVLDEEKINADHKLVHFRRQIAFTHLDGKMWVDKVFNIEKPDLETDLRVKTWLNGALKETKNATLARQTTGYDPTRLSQEALEAINTFYKNDFTCFGYEKL